MSSCALKKVVSCTRGQLTCVNYLVGLRGTSTTSKRKEKVCCDLVGQPNPISNLRSFKFYKPENENEIEKQFRVKREEVQIWNEEFWTKHNKTFIEERKAFIALHEKETTVDGIKKPISPDKLSVFYKTFLDKNWKTHLNYNYEWYKRNAMLILLAIRVEMYRIKRNLFRNNS